MVLARPPARARPPAAHRAARDPKDSSRPAGPPGGGFRPDIEGLRGVAVVAVLLYHAGIPFARGGYVGVDVFFVISGFLITGLLVGEMERTGTVSVAKFYARRVRRLLPSVVVVLAAVALFAWLVLPPVRRAIVSGDIVASGLYFVNWRLGARAVDYFAAGLETSPVQHFWSLAVEEQFYLVWPALLLLVTWPRRRAGRSVRGILVLALAAITVASFVYGVHLTREAAGAAYFSTLGRGWELGLGGLVALVFVAGRRQLSPRLAAALSAAGLAGIAWALVVLDDDTPFPGTAALAPTLGAAAVIVAGTAGASGWPHRLLETAPLRHVGRISYTWYLWHWPPLVFAQAYWGHVSAPAGALIVLGSYVPTIITHRLVEEPFRHARALVRRPVKAFRLAALCTGSVVVFGGVLQLATSTIPTAPQSDVVGARVLRQETKMQRSVTEIRPAPDKAARDRGRLYDDGCIVLPPDTTSPPCVYGDRSSSTTVVLLGDSHAMQWFPALNEVALARHWRVVALTKSACPAAAVQVYNTGFKRGYSECDTWRRHALERVERLRPAMVVTTGQTKYFVMRDGHRLDHHASKPELEDAWVDTLERLKATGARVVVLGETPHGRSQVPDCVAEHPHDLAQCAASEDDAFGFVDVDTRAANRTDGVRVIDPRSALCRHGVCPAVIGNALVYRNAGHLTATYVRTLGDWLGRRLPDRL